MFITPSQPPVIFTAQHYSLEQTIETPKVSLQKSAASSTVADDPFYSQFRDITSSKWQKVGCGVTSLAMIIDFYTTGTISVNKILAQGVAAGAYLQSEGWTYAGLIGVAEEYGLSGESYDLGALSSASAYTQFKDDLIEGPVIASVHYKLDPKNTIPHLIVVNGVKDGMVYYNDPAAQTAEKKIAVAEFLKAWKKRYIVVRPPEDAHNTYALLEA